MKIPVVEDDVFVREVAVAGLKEVGVRSQKRLAEGGSLASCKPGLLSMHYGPTFAVGGSDRGGGEGLSRALACP
ncbi:hypothetical protein MicloDRAFT_00031150 [Microvirga lotononidis]|uniref:Uncharacterized protein n=1 Tax=Microvirga lotononidis TaxID=864069 RepID=I4YRH4_9HYPH|nr:hypothetical protein MicloDRAFT_00031150 [Microvirga lotononidis]